METSVPALVLLFTIAFFSSRIDNFISVSNLSDTLRQASDEVTDLGGLMSQIAARADEQSSGVARISQVVGEMDVMTQRNSAMVEQATAATHGLTDEAYGLKSEVAQFRLGRVPQGKPVIRLAS